LREKGVGRSRSVTQPANLDGAQVVVVSSAIKHDNPELVAARGANDCRSCAAPKCWPS